MSKRGGKLVHEVIETVTKSDMGEREGEVHETVERVPKVEDGKWFTG